MVKPTLIVAAFSVAALSACSSHQLSSTASSTSAAPGAQTLSTELHNADGHATIPVKTTADHILPAGLHALHVHEVGKCEPNSVDPMMGGAPGDFLSAGMHYQAPGHTGEPMSGDLTALQVRQAGAGYLVTT